MDDTQLQNDDIRSALWHIASSLKGIELQLQKQAQNTDFLVGMSNSLEAFMGSYDVSSQPMGSFQEFLSTYQATCKAQSGDWVSPSVAAKAIGVSPRRLILMYDKGLFNSNCAKQVNQSSHRRRFLFNIKILQESIGKTQELSVVSN